MKEQTDNGQMNKSAIVAAKMLGWKEQTEWGGDWYVNHTDPFNVVVLFRTALAAKMRSSESLKEIKDAIVKSGVEVYWNAGRGTEGKHYVNLMVDGKRCLSTGHEYEMDAWIEAYLLLKIKDADKGSE